MVGERTKIPADGEYLASLGRAAYNFTYLEWGIIWLWECIDQGSISKAENKTAGQVADCFKQAVIDLGGDHPLRDRLFKLANDFKAVTRQRNSLLHAKPYTSIGDEQRLKYNGRHGYVDWPKESLDRIADEFSRLAIEAGELLHHGLYAQYQSRIGAEAK